MFDALEVALSASDTITPQLKDIASSAGDVGQEFVEAAGGSVEFAQGISVSEGEVQDLERTLNSIPDAAVTSAESLDHMQNVAEALSDESQQLDVNVELLEQAFSDLPPQIIQNNAVLSRLDSELESVESTTFSAATATQVLSEGMDEAAMSSTRMTLMAAQVEDELEDMRNDALQAAAATSTLSSAMASFDVGSIGARFGPIAGSLQTIAIVATVLTPVLLGLGSAFIGVATAAGAVAAAVGGLFAAGLVSRAEDMAAASAQIEDTAEGIEKIFSQVRSAIADAIEPLGTLENQEFALSALEGFVTFVGIAATNLAGMVDITKELASTLGGTVLQTSPALFESLERMVREVGPEVVALVSGLISDLPGAINFLTERTAKLLPVLGQFGDSLIALGAELAIAGDIVLSLLLPALTLLFDVLTGATQVINTLVTPAFDMLLGIFNAFAPVLRPLAKLLGTLIGSFFVVGGAIALVSNAATVASIAFGVLSTATSLLAGFLGTGLTGAIYAVGAAIWTALGPIGWAVIAIGALIGALSFLVDWSDILVGTWNSLIGIAEFLVNSLIGVSQWLMNTSNGLLMLVPGVGIIIALMANLGDIVNFVGGAFNWLGSVVDDVVTRIMNLIQPVIEFFGSIDEFLSDLTGNVGVEKEVDFGSAQLGSDDDDDDDPPPATGGMKQTVNNDNSTNVEIGEIDASGSEDSKSRIRRIVEEEVNRANQRSRRREDGRSG